MIWENKVTERELLLHSFYIFFVLLYFVNVLLVSSLTVFCVYKITVIEDSSTTAGYCVAYRNFKNKSLLRLKNQILWLYLHAKEVGDLKVKID